MSRPDKGGEEHPGGKWNQVRIVGSFFLVFILALTVSGCDLLPEEIIIPTLMPEEELPTAIARTAQALIDANPSPTTNMGSASATPDPAGIATPTAPTDSSPANDPTPEPEMTPTRILDTPSPSPTYALEDLSPTAMPDSLPYGVIQIINPGPLSKVTSPLQFHAYLFPGEDNRVRIALYGEDGRLLVRKVIRYSSPQENKVHLKRDLHFEISGVAETARLEVSTRDEYGRLTALTSTDVILLTEGDADINPPLNLYEKIIIEEPVPNTLVQGSSLIVKGFTRYADQDQLLVQIVNFRGGVVGSKIIGVSDQELDLGYHFFAGEVPYQVRSATWVQVQVTARDDSLSEVLHTSSVRILLSP